MHKVVREIAGFTIESGVPLTEPSKSRDKWSRLVAGMSIGDSVVLEKSGDVASFRMMCKKQGFNCKSRVIRDNDGTSTPDVRAWKLKHED
tara:strand:- start:330 stop:599 length:270 start_codon:yes stop_codon:yes gene_type:complete